MHSVFNAKSKKRSVIFMAKYKKDLMDGMRQVRLSDIQTMENQNVKPYTVAQLWNLTKSS